MSEAETLVQLANGGLSVVALAAVVALWRRLNAVTDRFTAYLEKSADNGDVAAQSALQRKE